MPPIDDKVVAMSFESSKFESGVNNTMSALDRLKAALHFPKAGKGLEDINAASKRIDLGHIARGVDSIKEKLSLLSVAALAIFANIANSAFNAGKRLVSAFTIDPLKAGFSEYTTNLNAVQTILANTQAAGVGLKEVNATLRELNHYSDQTIYNFSQMAKNIGTFTAAGVDLQTATASIKGIANLAALSGSSAEQASTAMYQLSQAISAGRVSLQDWNSVVNAGMGGTVFQRALAQTAEAMGTLKEGAVKLTGPMKNVSIAGESFRQSISAAPGKESWLTSKVLTATLKQFTGDLTNAELAAMGFNQAQIKAIQATAKTAFHAATEVKTLQGVLDTAKETAQSGWAETWQIIFGDFAEAKVLFTGISNAINGFISDNAKARNKVLGDWKALGGRTVLINSIKTAFQNLGAVIKPIKDAFRDIFPAKTGQDLYNLTLRFQDFANSLKPSAETVDNLRRTFRGLFAVFSIIGQVVGEVFGLFGRLFGSIGDGTGSFLEFTGGVGDFLVSIDQALKKGDGLHNFFLRIGDVLAVPLNLIRELASAIADLFGGFSSGGVSSPFEGMTAGLSPLQGLLEGISEAWSNFIDNVRDTGIMKAAFDGLIALIQGIGPAIGEAASNMNFEAILAVIRTGFFGALVLMLKQFLGRGSFLEQISQGLGGKGGILSNIAGSFKALEGSMVGLQRNLNAQALKEIAIAIGILAASVLALSFVSPEDLKKSLVAIGVMGGLLLGAMAALDKVAVSAGFVKLPVVAAGLILIAGAIDILAIAVFALSRLDWDELARGLAGVGGLLAGISAASFVLTANAAGMIRAGIGITGIAIAMNILALAMKQFAGLNWTEIAKGLISVAGGLAIISGAAMVLPKGLVLQGAGLIAIAAGLKILASAMEDFSGFSWTEIAKGLVGIGGALLVIAAAVNLMPKSMALQGAGLLLVALSLGKIADAVQKMGGMSVQEIAKGLATLAGALVILAGALYLMTGAIGGAVALTVAAAGVSLLAGALQKMGSMSWGEILKSLVALGAALGVIAAASLLLTPAIPVMLGLGAALLLIGGGLALAGAGIFLIGTGLSAIAVAGPAAIGILVAAFKEFVQAVIENAKLIVLGILEIAQAFADTAPQFVDALVKILSSLLDAVVQLAPQIGEAFTALITMAIKVLRDNQDEIIQAGFDLIKALLQGLKNNIPALVTLAVDIIVKFLNAITANFGRIVTAGTDMLKALVRGIVSVIPTVVTTALQVITRFLGAIADSLGRIVTAGLTVLTRFLGAIASRLGDVIRAGTNVITSFVTGIGDAASKIVTAARQSASKFINTLAREIVKLADTVFQAMITLLNGLADVIERRAPEMRAAGARLGVAIADGMTFGLASKAASVASQAASVAQRALGAIAGAVGADSPAKETIKIGKYMGDGLAVGLGSDFKAMEAAAALGKNTVGALKKSIVPEELREIGKAVGQEFAKALRGSAEDIRNAFRELNEMLTEAMVKARETIAEENAKLKKLRAADKEDAEAIKKAQKIIAENEAILARATAGHKALTKELQDEKKQLIALANDYERISEKLKTAEQALADAKRVRDDAIKSYTAQYSDLPEFAENMAEQIAEANTKIAEAQANLNKVMTESAGDIEKIAAAQKALAEAEAAKGKLLADVVLDETGTQVDLVATYMEDLRQQTEAVRKYRQTLDELRKMGLDDATYKKLLEEGTAGQEFADALLAGGETAVKGVNELSAELEKESKKLGTVAAKELYQAGVDSAKGLVEGLRSQKGAARRAAEELAEEMLRVLKQKMQIKSPSEVMAEIGRFMGEGLAKGFSDSSKIVTDAVADAAEDALTAMKSSVRNISDIVAAELNPNPVITPILDLTAVRNQASQLGSIVSPIYAASSYGQAALISSSQLEMQEEMLAAGLGGTSLKFEQNNYSPKALSEIEIYRQTRNQLSQIRSSLALS